MISSMKLSVSALIGAVLAFYILLVFEFIGFDLSVFLSRIM